MCQAYASTEDRAVNNIAILPSRTWAYSWEYISEAREIVTV